MNKKKFILGILIAITMAICGAFLINTPSSVFASETPEQTIETITTEAGTFSGQGYYDADSEVKLTAVMNKGYAFDAWVSVADDKTETILSTNQEYTFVVESKMKIEYRYHAIEYTIG